MNLAVVVDLEAEQLALHLVSLSSPCLRYHLGTIAEAHVGASTEN